MRSCIMRVYVPGSKFVRLMYIKLLYTAYSPAGTVYLSSSRHAATVPRPSWSHVPS